jgi:ATP-dependent DNA helicase RecG
VIFARVAKQARAFLKTHDEARFEALCAEAALATPEVPEARRADWEKLLLGLTQHNPDPKRDARVEGLVRACKLFAAEERRAVEERTPLAWEDPLERITGIGAASSEELAARGVTTIADLVWTLPQAYDDLRQPLGVAEAIELALAAGEPRRVVVAGTMESASVVPMRGRRSIRVIIAPAASEPQKSAKKIHAWWFFMAHGVLSLAKAGGPCLVVGKLRAEPSKPARTMHPELFVDRPDARVVRPRYPRLGIAEATLRKSIASALDRMEGVPDPVPRKIAAREKLPEVGNVLAAVHGRGGTLGDLPTEPSWRAARERLAWAEAFTRARERILAEARQGDAEAMALPIDRGAIARLQAELGFALTGGQKRAMSAIAKDLAQSKPMRRLLLGDVGTGKTAVALAAAAQAVAAGTQVAILAPTSVLAEQYMDAVGPLARSSKASIALVAAGGRIADRRRAEAGIANGSIAIAVGTHALLRESLVFHKLGLVVVDEQHRLGVAQRLSLVAKGSGEGRGPGARPHLLTLSATPIPRTLALALRGELATSTTVVATRTRVLPSRNARMASIFAAGFMLP